ncbi:MAG: hypothetical protein ACM31C_03310 [Acidobacteriota bacterium]
MAQRGDDDKVHAIDMDELARRIASQLHDNSTRIRLGRGTGSPRTRGDDDDEWSADTPLMLQHRLSELVRQTQRVTLPALATPKPVEADEEITEIVAPLPQPPPPAAIARRPVQHAPWLLAIAILASAGAALPYIADATTPHVQTAAIAQLHGDADELSRVIDAAQTAAAAHVHNLATTPLLRAGIETDAPTIADLADHEGLFAPIAGATFEVFQARDGGLVSMVRRPASAPPFVPPADGVPRLASDGRAVRVIASAPIAPQTNGPGGVLAIALPVDLGQASHALGEHALAAMLTGLEHPVVLVATTTSQGEPITIPLARPAGLALAAVIAAPAPESTVVPIARAGLWGAASLLLGLYGLALRRRDRPAR